MTNPLKTLLDRFDSYLFEKGSPITLGLLRLLIGISAIWILFTLLLRFDLWFSTSGWLNSNCANITETNGLSLLNGVSSNLAIQIFFAISLLSALCMTLGFYTRISSFLTWLCMTSIQTRATAIMCGGDVVIIFLLFYLIFSDSGACLSIDRYRQKKNGDAQRVISLWPQKLMAIQISIVYLSAVAYKLLDSCWTNGSAVYYTLNYISFRNFWVPDLIRNPPFTTFLTYLTLITESALGLTYFIPKIRKAAVLGGIFLHLGFMYMIMIPNFGPIMIISYLTFFTGEEVSNFLILLRLKFTKLFLLKSRIIAP